MVSFPRDAASSFRVVGSLPPKKYRGIHVSDDGVGVVFVNRFKLALCLEDEAGGYLTTSDCCDQLLQPGDLPDIGGLVYEAAHMDRQPAAIHIISLFAQQVEKLGVGHSNQKVHAVLGVAHYEEQGCLAISEGVQFQLVIGGQVPDLLNVKNRGSGRRADKDTFGCLTRNELSRTF